MRIEITYFADDGEEFGTEEECREYEESLKTDLNSVIFFTEDHKLMKYPKLKDIEQEAYYLKVLDPEKAEKLFDWLHYQISFDWIAGEPIKDHYYRWNEADYCVNGYVDFTKELEELQKTMAELMIELDKEKNKCLMK